MYSKKQRTHSSIFIDLFLSSIIFLVVPEKENTTFEVQVYRVYYVVSTCIWIFLSVFLIIASIQLLIFIICEKTEALQTYWSSCTTHPVSEWYHIIDDYKFILGETLARCPVLYEDTELWKHSTLFIITCTLIVSYTYCGLDKKRKHKNDRQQLT